MKTVQLSISYRAFLLVFIINLGLLPGGLSTSLADPQQPAATDTKKQTSEKQKKDSAKEDQEYYELLRLFVDTLDQVDRNYVKDVSRRELMEAAIESMVRKLDQYSNYIPPAQIERFKTSVENEFG